MYRLVALLLLIFALGCDDDPASGPFYDTAVSSLGTNEFGVLGDGTEYASEASIQLSSIIRPIRLEASAKNSMALTADGKLFVWGDNRYGQLGTNEAGPLSSTPIQVLPNYFVKAMSVGGSFSAAVTADGKLWMWGTLLINVSGGDVLWAIKPTVVSGMPRLKEVNCGNNHCLALSEDGEVWSWGINTYGQLGDGSQIGSIKFKKVLGLPLIKHIAVGANHSVALSVDGEVFVWGSNEFGQLGISSQHFIPEPLTVHEKKWMLEPLKSPWLENIVDIKSGDFHSIALGSDGKIMTWGRGSRGQLASFGVDNLWRPRKASGIADVVMIYASGNGSCAFTNYGEFYSWGNYNPLSKSYLGEYRTAPTLIPCFKWAVAIARSDKHYLVAKRKEGDNTSDCFLY